MKSATTFALLAFASVLNAQALPPVGPSNTICTSQITDACGEDGQPECCYAKYTKDGLSCLNGHLSLDLQLPDPKNDCGEWEGFQRDIGCSCPKDCTTGDIDGKGKCV
ncbi:uncharacterized protein N7469_007488 [Penicillium citrinum]|uniref:Uncharacterized protein n=1 Tax=Penicillium citrinum TaxID=5077 RepID=A0A9W9NWX1_PENCI|nr:uncharacterized protein N7469_007488 [Penicillium citrinum]KAJ5227482.1 hypothetical protein N7469_007488 [Penicillium citrinum]